MKPVAILALGWMLVGGLSEAEAGPVEVKVTIGSDCKMKVAPPKTTVYQSKRDVLVWTISSECKDQKVKIYLVEADEDRTSPAPFEECKGDPKAANVGGQFTVYGGGSGAPSYATITCHIDWDNYLHGTFEFGAVTASKRARLTTDDRSELSLEVEP